MKRKLSILCVACLTVISACTGHHNNALFDNTGLATSCILTSDTTILLIRDYFPKLKDIDEVSCQDFTIESYSASGSMDTIMVISNVNEPLLSAIDVFSRGQKGSIVVFNNKGFTPDASQVPFMSTISSLDFGSRFLVKTQNAPAGYMIFWQNTRLDSKHLKYRETGGFEVSIPSEAERMDRSYIRVFASNKNGIGNDLLVPLEYGKVVVNASYLDRKDKHTQILYSLLIDRFYNGNPGNDWKIDNPSKVLPKVDYYGGDLAGVTAKIKSDYFDSLGVNTIWLSPITQNPYNEWGLNQDPKTRFSGYHGYWPIYITKIDKRFGTSKELEQLLDEAHKREENVILDYVANHMHINSPTLKAHPDWTTPSVTPDGRPNFELWDEFRLTTWFDKHIPSLDLEKEYINEPLTDSALFWMKNFAFDGFRHDATKHIPEVYWRKLTRKILDSIPERQLFQIGETYGSPELISSYVKTGMLDGQFDFNVYDNFINATTEPDGSFVNLSNTIMQSLNTYGYHNLMGYITGNHDRARYISIAGGDLIPGEDYKAAGWKRDIGISDSTAYNKLSLLHAMIFTLPGLPCIYYGDEYGQPGANDPDNRRWAQFAPTNAREADVYGKVSDLAHLRRNLMPLLYGDYYPVYCDNDLLVYMRIYMGRYVVMALNKSAEKKKVSFTLPFDLQYRGSTQMNFFVDPLSYRLLQN